MLVSDCRPPHGLLGGNAEAKAAAQLQLELTDTWTQAGSAGRGARAPQVYHLLVDAAVYNAEWPRAVSFIEELIDYGLPRGLRTFGTVAPRPVNYGKHARLLQDVAVDTRNLAALQGAERRALGTDFSSVTETEKVDAPLVQPMERP